MSNKAFRAHVKTDQANTKGRKRGTASTGSCGIPHPDQSERDAILERLKGTDERRK